MHRASSPVESPQTGPDRRLERYVRRHLDRPFRKPPAEHSRTAFAGVDARIREAPAPIILDAGCGTGDSTVRLAQRHPRLWVVGVDRSEHRLRRGRSRPRPDNALLVRAELADFWLLAARAGWRVHGHFLLYPNPYPKPRHLGRRWHASAAFPRLLALGGALELRTNWSVYAQEFAAALELSGHPAVVESLEADAEPISPFERKYRASAHGLFRVRVDLDTAPAAAGRKPVRPGAGP